MIKISSLDLLAIVATNMLELKSSSNMSTSMNICKSCKSDLFVSNRRTGPDGTLLCNACGIRWKKYKVKCDECGRIGNKTYGGDFYCANCAKLIAN